MLETTTHHPWMLGKWTPRARYIDPPRKALEIASHLPDFSIRMISLKSSHLPTITFKKVSRKSKKSSDALSTFAFSSFVAFAATLSSLILICIAIYEQFISIKRQKGFGEQTGSAYLTGQSENYRQNMSCETSIAVILCCDVFGSDQFQLQVGFETNERMDGKTRR